MKQYHELLNHIIDHGTFKGDRTGTGTYSIFGYQMRFDLSEGFPLVTSKKCHLRSIIHELLWFIKGDTNTKYLNDNGVSIWDEWATMNGDLGPIYGKQWREWESHRLGTIDQLSDVIAEIKGNPNSRRLIVSAWNPSVLPDSKISTNVNIAYGNQALPPCHCLFQFYVLDGKLSCQLYQRSADVFLGVPFNIASYALLTMMIAKECNLEVGEFIHTFGDAHIYSNHIDQVQELLSREPKELPKMEILNDHRFFNMVFEDFQLTNYEPWPTIKAPVAV